MNTGAVAELEKLSCKWHLPSHPDLQQICESAFIRSNKAAGAGACAEGFQSFPSFSWLC